MNPPKLKTTLLMVGILPALLVSIFQIGYLNYRQSSDHESMDPLPAPASVQSSVNERQSLHETRALIKSEYQSLMLASSLIGLMGILLAGCMANAFSRRLSHSPKMPPIGSETDNTITASDTVETNSSPFGKPADTLPIPPNPYAAAAPSEFSVLIADDNNINRLLLRNQVEGRCQKSTIAKDGIEALKYLTSERFDLILLDLQMPGHSGLELIKIIKQDQCINRNTPVIAITAHAQLSQRKTIIAEGFDECLIKPILTEQLDEIFDLWRPHSSQAPSFVKQTYSQQILNKTCQNFELASTIAKKLFEELPQQLRHIETALKNQHAERALEITHKLHGSVSFCGLTNIQKPAYALEQSLLNNDYNEANLVFSKLRAVTEEFIESEQTTLDELGEQKNHTLE